jgi:hypothetical protein
MRPVQLHVRGRFFTEIRRRVGGSGEASSSHPDPSANMVVLLMALLKRAIYRHYLISYELGRFPANWSRDGAPLSVSLERATEHTNLAQR